MKIGVVVNRKSGKSEYMEECLKKLSVRLESHDLFCVSGSFSNLEAFFPGIKCIGESVVTDSYLDTVNAGRHLDFVDYIVSLGGDGTVSDIITGLRDKKRHTDVPVIAIGCGSANAGPFVCFRFDEDYGELSLDAIKPRKVAGLDVFNSLDEYMGTAFNDVVLSETTISTVDGRMCTVDTRDYLKGNRIKRDPSVIETESTCVSINGVKLSLPFKMAQIIVSPVYNKEFYSFKAITGKLCWMNFTADKDAMMVISSSPVIRMFQESDLMSHQPMLLSQYLLSDNDTVQIEDTKGYLVIDGNPRIDMENGKAKIVFNKVSGVTLER